MGDQRYDINNMIVFAVVGLVIKWFFGNTPSPDGSSGKASATIWGYGVVSLAILGIMIISFALGSDKIRTLGDMSFWNFLKGISAESFPSVFTLIILFWIISLNLTYFKKINQALVATEYYTFSNSTTYMLFFQLMALLKYLNNRIKIGDLLKSSGNTPELTRVKRDNSRLAFGIYFLTFLNLVLTMMMNITLQYFSTDG
jgi:hypothetical protein